MFNPPLWQSWHLQVLVQVPQPTTMQQECILHRCKLLHTSKRKKRFSHAILCKGQLEGYTEKASKCIIHSIKDSLEWSLMECTQMDYVVLRYVHLLYHLKSQDHVTRSILKLSNSVGAYTRGWRNLFILGDKPLEFPISQGFQGECVSDSLLSV